MTWPWNYLYLFGVKSIYFKLEWKFTFSWVVRLEKLMQDVFEEVVMEGLMSLQKREGWLKGASVWQQPKGLRRLRHDSKELIW